MSVCRSFLRPASAARRSASCIPNREDCGVVGMRQPLMRIDSDGVLVLPGAPKTGLGRVFVRARFGFPAVPDPIRGVPL